MDSVSVSIAIPKQISSEPSSMDEEDEELLDSSDTEDILSKPILPTEQGRKKLANIAAFQQHLRDNTEDQDDRSDQADDNIRAIKSPSILKAADESARIIDTARDYQQELFERAKEDNVLAVLDTGSGKTLIACLLIKHTLAQNLIDRKEGKLPRTVVFLVNSVHLVIQQAQVLANNLAQPPAVLYGSIKENLWKRETWTGVLETNQAVVCTAEVLYQALFHNYVSIESVSLLVFDECHHAKKGHPYARIILDYYMRSPAGQRRPKIFGMTASPVHTKGNMMKAFEELEMLLHAKVITTTSMSLLEHAPRAWTDKWTYDRPQHAVDTELTLQVANTCNIEELHQALHFARDATSTLGRWASDQMWSYVFSKEEAKSIIKRFEQSKAYQQIQTSEERQNSTDALRRMALVIDDIQCRESRFTRQPDLDSEELSSKVVVLAQQLKRRYSQNHALRTIVFVEQRLTAELLTDCFTRLNFKNIRPGALVGANQALRSYGLQSRQSNKQHTIMEHFRHGFVNCVFATNVAEEGIDIPQCSLVVRFDLFKTPIQYMQSRGRARMKDSVYAIMMEKDNEEHRKDITYAMDFEDYIKLFCSKLPADRMLDTTEARLRRLVQKHAGTEFFVTSSGARCSLGESLVILARYASSLRFTGAITTAVHYELCCKDGQFRYGVKLPNGSEVVDIGKIRGRWMPNKNLAKRSAAWYCCYELRKRKLLDENLDSIHERQQHRNNNARWAVNNKQERYEAKTKPDFWRRGAPIAGQLYASIVRLVPSREMKHKLVPFVLFSRDPLPTIPRFPVYLEDDIATQVVFEPILLPVPVTFEQVDDITAYTLRVVFDDVFHKTYAHSPVAMSYWLAPFNDTVHQAAGTPQLENIVQVSEMQLAQRDRISWEPGMAATLWSHKFLVDKWTGAFRYISYGVVPDATIDSPVPEGALGAGKKSQDNVQAFTCSRYKKSKQRNVKDVDPGQPVLDCEFFNARRDFLDTNNAFENSKSAVRCHAVPQPLEIGRLPAALAFTLLAWPSILHRLESYLIALEGFAKLDLPVPADLALEAFTAANANDEDGAQTHSSSIRGMGKNYERLEFIGDSLLKMTTTLTVFCIKHKAPESEMHCDRMQMLSNINLFNVSKDESLKLYENVRTSGLNRKTWYPEGLILLKGRGGKAGLNGDALPVAHQKTYQDLGKKTIADVSEAIIGASYQASKHLPNKFDLSLKAITQLVCDDLHPINKWSEIAPLYKPQSWQLQMNDPLAADLASKVEQGVKMGYHFKHPRLVRSALTHASDSNSPVPDYQRLEFLGDAVLDMVSISWMFNKYEDKDPQWLTEHKMAMVSNRFLAILAVTLGFDKLMIANNVALEGHVGSYARRVKEVWDQGKENIPCDFWTGFENEPKALSDLVEAYVGALMVDSGFDYALVERFFEKHILWFFEDLDSYTGYVSGHPVTHLHHKLTDEYKCTNYALECAETAGSIDVNVTAAVLIHQKVIETSKSDSSRTARLRVAKKTLQLLDGLTVEQFREKYHCDCKRKAILTADLK